MDKWQSQQKFWDSFGVPAYDEQTVIEATAPEDYRYITYEGINDSVYKPTMIAVNVYDRSESWQWISKKVDQIFSELSGGGALVEHDGGYMWLKIPESTPFAQRQNAGTEDKLIKRIYLSIEVEFI